MLDVAVVCGPADDDDDERFWKKQAQMRNIQSRTHFIIAVTLTHRVTFGHEEQSVIFVIFTLRHERRCREVDK